MSDVNMEAWYTPSGDVVTRVIEGELIIVPITAGVGDMDDQLFSVNESGKIIWDKLDGKTSLTLIVQSLADQYSISSEEMEKDVRGFVGELLRRKMIIDARTSRTSS
jgi:hypothetical protein